MEDSLINGTDLSYPSPLSLELSQGSRFRLLIARILPGNGLAIANRLPVPKRRSGRRSLDGLWGAVTGTVHIVIFDDPADNKRCVLRARITTFLATIIYHL